MQVIKDELLESKWVIPKIIVPVREKMISALGGKFAFEDVSTTYLASGVYKLEIHDSLSSSRCQPLTLVTAEANNVSKINHQLKKLFPGSQGELIKANDLVPYANEWVFEFTSICKRLDNYEPLISFLEYIFMLDGVKFRGASHPHVLSSLFLQLKANDLKNDFFVSIIHETAHQELFLINFIDRLVNSQYDFNLIHAPYQNKIRPPIGRLHSLHALYRMIMFCIQANLNNPKFEFFVAKFKENISSFGSNELTEFGSFLLKEIYEPFSETL